MKRNKYFSLVGLVVLLALALVSCVPPTTATPAATTTTVSPITQVQTDVTALKADIASLKSDKAPNSSITTLESRLSSVEGKVNNLQSQGTGNSYTKAQTYTQDEVNALITKLKSDQSWITSSTTSTTSTSTGSTTGSVSFVTNPVSIPQLFTASSGSQSTFYTLRVVNGTSAWQYVKPIVTLNLASSYSATTLTAMVVNMTYGSFNLMSTASNFSISPALGVSTSSVVIIPISGGATTSGEFQVAAGQAIDILVQITGVTTSTTVLWNIANSISARQM